MCDGCCGGASLAPPPLAAVFRRRPAPQHKGAASPHSVRPLPFSRTLHSVRCQPFQGSQTTHNKPIKMAKAKSAAKADKKAATADAKALKVKAEAKKVRCGRKIWAVSLGVRTYGAQTRRSSACCDAETAARALTPPFARASHATHAYTGRRQRLGRHLGLFGGRRGAQGEAGRRLYVGWWGPFLPATLRRSAGRAAKTCSSRPHSSPASYTPPHTRAEGRPEGCEQQRRQLVGRQL